jgi:hypothetical protein
MQRRPVKKTKHIVTDMAQMIHKNSRSYGKERENLTAPFTSPKEDMD